METPYDFIKRLRFIPHVEDLALEMAVTMYQETGRDCDFEIIRDLYRPEQYEQAWFDDYGFLFGYSRPDFHSEFMLCFAKACKKYRPGPNRKLNSYFYGVLYKTMVNALKRKAVGFRNIEVRCPLCSALVAPLSTHLLRKHLELADDVLMWMGKDPTQTSECPLCPAHHRKVVFKNEEHRRKHILSRHSSQVFSAFIQKFPGHSTALDDPAPALGVISNKDGEMMNDPLAEMAVASISTIGAPSNDGEILVTLLSDDTLSPCQRTIAEMFLYEDNEHLPSFDRLCQVCMEKRNTDDCPRGDKFKITRSQYKQEMSDLGQMLRTMIADR